MRLPIDTSALQFVCSLPPEPVVEYENRNQPKVDRDGEPVFSMELIAMGAKGSQIFGVKFSGTPAAGLKQGMPVRVAELEVSDWAIDGRHGLSFRAGRIEPLNGHAPAPAKSGGAS
ncbi:MAG TPA: hypothetical protein VFW71_11805 [Actinomycetota bacterium]|nr:hypothetical protein [Actinomycetota bacterium]